LRDSVFPFFNRSDDETTWSSTKSNPSRESKPRSDYIDTSSDWDSRLATKNGLL